MPDECYCVVLDPRGRDEKGALVHYFLWAMFICEGHRQLEKMMKRYERGLKIN